MGKQAKPQALRGGHEPKAGKKKAFQEPPSPNVSKKEAREKGRQQFISARQLTVPDTKIVFDKKTQRFVTKLVDLPVPFVWDATRKNFVYSPREDRE